MIVGPIGGRDRDNYYVQTNNPTEQILKKYRGSAWLVSCGSSTMINCITALGADVEVWVGGYKMQPEEVVTDFLNDPRNYPKLRAIRDLDPEQYAGQEVPQYYPYAASVLFGATAKFEFGHDWENIIDHLEELGTVQLCLKTPGHYIAVVGYDTLTDELIYNDSWPGRHEDGNGFNVRMTEQEFQDNVKPFRVKYFSVGL